MKKKIDILHKYLALFFMVTFLIADIATYGHWFETCEEYPLEGHLLHLFGMILFTLGTILFMEIYVGYRDRYK